jgi:SAM-dependent methyltransferase
MRSSEHARTTDALRNQMTERYSGLARAALAGDTVIDCGPDAFAARQFGAASYATLDGLPAGAVRASMGCGNPVAVADLHDGDDVLDLGSGGGIDVLLSGRRVGPTGRVYGVDASEDMVRLARANAEEAGASNVVFLHGSIEQLPLPDDAVDVVISNCVINLSTDKPRALAEAFRVLRPGGRLGISDVLARPDLQPNARAEAEHRVGCLAGTLTEHEYRTLLRAAGFTDIAITPTTDTDDGLFSAIVRATKLSSPEPGGW